VFMDNSNLYISAKRMVAAKLGLQEPWSKMGDPRFRIDYAKLKALVEAYTWEIETLTEEVSLRSAVHSVDVGIYGSDMAKLEGILKEKGARFVNIPFRGTQEKQVDASIMVDIERLMRLLPRDREPVREEDVIILIAGDGDFIPVVEDAVSEGWRVEIWSFSQVMAGHFARLSNMRDDHGYPILRTVNLDDYLFSGRMGFIQYEAKEYSHEASCIIHLSDMFEDEVGAPAHVQYTGNALNKWAKMQVCVRLFCILFDCLAHIGYDTNLHMHTCTRSQGRKWAEALTSRYAWPTMFVWQSKKKAWMMVFYSLAHAHDVEISNSAFEICQRFICGKEDSIKWLYEQVNDATNLPWRESMNLQLSSTMPTARDLHEESSFSTENSYSAIDSDSDMVHSLATALMSDVPHDHSSVASESSCARDSDLDTVLSMGSTSMIFPRYSLVLLKCVMHVLISVHLSRCNLKKHLARANRLEKSNQTYCVYLVCAFR
jgi:hypothetical protein